VHQALIIRDIDFRLAASRRASRPEPHQMVQNRRARKCWVDGHGLSSSSGPRIVGVAGVAQVDLTEPRERHPVAPVAGRHHAIEHIDAARDRLQDVLGRAERPSDIAGAPWAGSARPPRSSRASPIAVRRPRVRRSRSRENRSRQAPRAGTAQFRHIAALRDAEQHAAFRRGSRRRACCARPNAMRAAWRVRYSRAPPAAARIRPSAWRCRSRAAAAPRSSAPATVRCWRPSICERKVTALSPKLAQLRQRHHLEAAGVREHRALPAGKALQAPEPGDALGARPQHQMVGIAKHDIGAGIAHLAPMQALHGAGGADRHEGRRPHHAMQRGQLARAWPGRRCRAVRNDWLRSSVGLITKQQAGVRHRNRTGSRL